MRTIPHRLLFRVRNAGWESPGKKERRKTDAAFRILCSVRSRIFRALKGKAKPSSVAAQLGSVEDALRHIEAQFRDGMTWENWGRGWHGRREWHLDHKKPLASFDITDPEQMAEACHYSNLQPLWASENLAKGAK